MIYDIFALNKNNSPNTLSSTSDFTGRRLKHSFPASIALSCSSSLKCASASTWYASVKIDESVLESEM